MTHNESVLYFQALHAINATVSGLRCVGVNLLPAVEAMEEGPARDYALRALSDVVSLRSYLLECTAQQTAEASCVTYESGSGHQTEQAAPASDAAAVVLH